MLQAYVDDSTSASGDESFFLAGYINTAEMWEAFADAWREALARSPAIEYLKMTEAEALRGQFAGWSRVERDNKLMLLAQIINLSAPHFFYCRVSRLEYIEIITPVAPYNLKNPYFASFWGVIDTVARYCQNDKDVLPVEFIFDQQEGLGRDAAMFYAWLKEDLEPSLRASLGGTPIFADDKTMLPLQAADMLAWHVRRDHEQSNNEVRPVHDLITSQGIGRVIDRKELTIVAGKMLSVPGVGFVQTKSEWRRTRASTLQQIESGKGPPSTNRLWMRYVHARHLISIWRAKLRHRKR